MKRKLTGIVLVCAFSAAAHALSPAGTIKHREGDAVQLSTGEIVKVAAYEELEYDSSRKPGKTLQFVVFESSTGARVAMHSTTTGKRVQTSIKSMQGPDLIRFDVDYEGQQVPYVVEINGERVLLSVSKDSKTDSDRAFSKVAPGVAKLSPDFRNALNELYALLRAGYPGLGSGPMSLGILLDHDAAAALPDVDVISKTSLSKAEIHELFETSVK